MDEDYYALLGVTSDASEELIRQAYRRQAKVSHPDLRRDPQAEALMRRLNAAREVLLDPQRRRSYDLRWAVGAAPQRPPMARDGFDVNETVTITVAHAATGTTYERSFHRPDGGPTPWSSPSRLALPVARSCAYQESACAAATVGAMATSC